MASDQQLPDTSSTKLYEFNKDDKFLKFGAPRIVPKGGRIVNVTQEFPWTTLPADNRTSVPCIEMTEYRVTSSTLIQSFIQQARSSVDAFGGSSSNLLDAIKKGASVVGFSITDEDLGDWLSSSNAITDKTFLDPYRHLYPTKPTGWQYIFPFLTNQNQKVSNEWTDADKSEASGGVKEATMTSLWGGAVGNLLNSVQVAAKMSKVSNILQPGSFTENIKHFSPTEGEAYKVNFTLYNTLDYKDIQTNWELCFVLTYQNRPNRRSVSLLDPTVIYSVTIPGVNQFLYAFISDLEVTNMGTSRYVDLPVGKKLIPEAYNISFTVKSLLTPTQNLLLYAHTGSKVEASVS